MLIKGQPEPVHLRSCWITIYGQIINQDYKISEAILFVNVCDVRNGPLGKYAIFSYG